MQRYASLIIYSFLTFSIPQTVDSKEKYDPQSDFKSFMDAEIGQFEQTKDEFEIYKQQLQSAFEQYKKQVSRVWGTKDSVTPNSKNWISYQDDLQHRSIVDFEHGTVEIEVAINTDEKVSDSEAQKRLQQTIIKSLKQGTDNRSVIDLARQPVSKPAGSAVLAGLVARKDGSRAKEKDYKTLASNSASQAQKKIIKGGDGKSRTIYKTRLHLVPDHIKIRAQKYKSQIDVNAHQQKIPSAMILAIMETESMFNPTARSPAPAFGLMQLVPTSGARDAYQQLYNKDRIVSDRYLYVPENNIKLGAAYLHRLYYNYLSEIKDPVSRQWATIAAYNTGSGNVFRAFAGKYQKSLFGSRTKWKRIANSEINKMTSEQVYSFLHRRLPYVETRHYIEKVSRRMKKY